MFARVTISAFPHPFLYPPCCTSFFRFRNVVFEITSKDVGTFEVSGKFMGVSMEKVELVFQVCIRSCMYLHTTCMCLYVLYVHLVYCIIQTNEGPIGAECDGTFTRVSLPVYQNECTVQRYMLFVSAYPLYGVWNMRCLA